MPETSIQNSMWSLVVSIKILLSGVTKPASPIRPITGPSAAVPSCLCPEVLLNTFNNWSYSLLNNAAVMVSPSLKVLCGYILPFLSPT